MTVVLKNNTDIHPSSSSGTTLFIKQSSGLREESEVGRRDGPYDENRPANVHRAGENGKQNGHDADKNEEEEEEE